jgi:hypothetical protein
VRRAPRLVGAVDPLQEIVEGVCLGVAQGSDELLRALAGCLSRPGELGPAGARQEQRMATSIVGCAAPFDQAGGFR